MELLIRVAELMLGWRLAGDRGLATTIGRVIIRDALTWTGADPAHPARRTQALVVAAHSSSAADRNLPPDVTEFTAPTCLAIWASRSAKAAPVPAWWQYVAAYHTKKVAFNGEFTRATGCDQTERMSF